MSDSLVRDFTHDDLTALRQEIERFAAGHGLADLALYRFVVAVNELTTNAVRHGGGAGVLELRTPALCCTAAWSTTARECRHAGRRTPRRRCAPSTDEDCGWPGRTPPASTSTASRPAPASP